MDNKALAEAYVELYRYIADNYEAKTGAQPTTEVTNMIFEQTCKRIISDLIGKQRQGVPAQHEGKPKSDTKCIECGNLLTVGEKKYCDDSDKQYRCYRCTHKND